MLLDLGVGFFDSPALFINFFIAGFILLFLLDLLSLNALPGLFFLLLSGSGFRLCLRIDLFFLFMDSLDLLALVRLLGKLTIETRFRIEGLAQRHVNPDIGWLVSIGSSCLELYTTRILLHVYDRIQLMHHSGPNAVLKHKQFRGALLHQVLNSDFSDLLVNAISDEVLFVDYGKRVWVNIHDIACLERVGCQFSIGREQE